VTLKITLLPGGDDVFEKIEREKEGEQRKTEAD
jgi:hypothetical protein